MKNELSAAAIVDRWQDVPPVETAHLDLAKHHVKDWVRKDNLHTYWDLTNPQRDTAYHCAVLLPKYPMEVWAAYGVLAFTRERLGGILGTAPFWPAIDSLMKAHGQDCHWWNANARLVLPPLHTPIDKGVYWETETPDWRQVLDDAARYWKAAAEQSMPVWNPAWGNGGRPTEAL